MKPLPATVALLFLGLAAAVTIAGLYNVVQIWYLPPSVSDRAPRQPVDFSHKLHAGQFGIRCLFCHRYAKVSRVAGVPDVDTCRSCHVYIASDRPEVKKVLGYWNRQEPIPWVKVHDLPDFVYFPHRTHLAAGLDCHSCHGAVETMERVKRLSGLNMTWCLDCHRERGVGIDCWICHK